MARFRFSCSSFSTHTHSLDQCFDDPLAFHITEESSPSEEPAQASTTSGRSSCSLSQSNTLGQFTLGWKWKRIRNINLKWFKTVGAFTLC